MLKFSKITSFFSAANAVPVVISSSSAAESSADETEQNRISNGNETVINSGKTDDVRGDSVDVVDSVVNNENQQELARDAAAAAAAPLTTLSTADENK